MSLDIYLYVPGECGMPGSGIFIREDGVQRQITEEEWFMRFPDREPVRAPSALEPPPYVWHGNLTHNLTAMAQAAGLYQAVWRPESLGIQHAAQLTASLRAGLATLYDTPEKFQSLNPANGWGDYEGFITFIQEYLVACGQRLQATIEVSR